MERFRVIISIKSTLLFTTITVKNGIQPDAWIRLLDPIACLRVDRTTWYASPWIFWQRSSFSPCFFCRFFIMNVREERRLGSHISFLVERRCIQNRCSKGLQYDIKRSIPRMAITSARNTHVFGAFLKRPLSF